MTLAILCAELKSKHPSILVESDRTENIDAICVADSHRLIGVLFTSRTQNNMSNEQE